jgi:4-hydroxyacetophenone monooxygenase
MTGVTTGGANPFLDEIEPITASDDDIRAVLEDAELLPLLAALSYATSDVTLLRPELRPDPNLNALPQGGLTAEQQREARAVAFEALVCFRDNGSRPAPPPSRDDLVAIMEFAVGGSQMDDYVPLLEEELALRGDDRRGPDWHRREVAPDTDFRVAVIGAGMSGLLAAHRLAQAGIDFVVL